MNLYHVRVIGDYEETRYTHKKPRKIQGRMQWLLLLEAPDADAAMAAGATWADQNAPSDRRWLGFEAIMASTAVLPIVLAGGA